MLKEYDVDIECCYIKWLQMSNINKTDSIIPSEMMTVKANADADAWHWYWQLLPLAVAVAIAVVFHVIDNISRDKNGKKKKIIIKFIIIWQ